MMKRFTYLLLPVLFFTSFLYSQSNHDSHNHKKIPNEIYQKIKISNPSPELINKLGRIGLDLDCGSQFDSNGDLLIEVSTHEASKVKEITNYNVVISDMESFYAKRAIKDLPAAKEKLKLQKLKNKISANKNSSIKNTTFGNITHRFENTEIDWALPNNFQLGASFGGCLTVDETSAQLDLMKTLYPNLITTKVNASPTNQLTIGGRPVYVVKISNSAISGTKPQTLYTGMTHSREVSSLMNLTYFMWYLLENYETDPDVKNLVDHHDLYFIPIVNPDGLAYNQAQSPTGGGMQRKNRRDTGACSTFLDGIDLNRNWGTYWGYDDQGSSPIGCDDTYRGTAGFSEAETTIIKDFFLLHNFKTSVNHHAYKNAALHGRAAFYHTNNNTANPGVPNGRENEYYQYSHDMTQFSRYAYGSSPNISYWNNGNCNDWMSEGSGKNTLCWTPENGATTGEGGFWPSPTIIDDIAKRAVRMNFIAGFYSGVYAKLHDLTKSDITSTSGTLSFGLERVGQTDGNFTLTVTPISSNILSVTNVGTQSGMTVLEQRNLDVNFTLSPTIAATDKIEFEVTLTNGTYIIYKTRIEKYYNPTNLFTANANPTNLNGWTASGTTSWAVTSTDGFGGTAGITTNTAASYSSAIIDANLTQTTAISLTGKQQVVVQFNAKWDLERSFDYVQLQGSADGGATWTPLNGKYTKPGTTTSVTDYSTTLPTTSKTTADKAFQPDNQPIYDGDKFDKWVLEEYYISATENSALFNSANVRFRFIFRTDSNNRAHGYNTTFKGFRFDNFKVLEIKSSPPVAICKNTTLSLNGAGSLTVLPSDVNDGSTDDIGITSISVSPNTFNCSHANTTQPVTLTVTDADGQTATCIANVTINAIPVATTTTISPASAISGGSGFTLTVNGTNFVNGQSLIRWNGANRTTTFVSTTQLTTVISAADIAAEGTANVSVINTCSTLVTSNLVFNITSTCPSTTWSGSPTPSWSNGTPTASSQAIIAVNYSGPAITACSLNVNSPANAVFTSGNASVSGAITVQSGATLTFENNVHLIQNTGSVNVGNVTFKRNTNPLKLYDYNAWSSPVELQGLLAFSPLTSLTPAVRFYTYTTSTNFYTSIGSPAINTETFTSGKGYLIRMPANHPTTETIWTGSFTGRPFNGTLSFPLQSGNPQKRFNLIGNPYPSAIQMSTFASENINNIETTAYFWRKTNNAASPSYCTVNLVSGAFTTNNESFATNPQGIIQIGQGFFVQAKAGATAVLFNNTQRTINNANQFFRNSASTSTTPTVENNIFWLNMIGTGTEFSQTAIGYYNNATQGIDDYDSEYYNDGAIAFTSIINTQDFAIQGRVAPFIASDVVPMKYKVLNSGTYSIVIDHAEGIFSSGNQLIYVKDNLTTTYHNLNTGAYTFTSDAGTFANRFEIVYQTALSNDVVDFSSNNVTLYNQNNVLNINSGNSTMETVKVFDIRGRLLVEKKNIIASETQVNVPPTNQVLIVEITSMEGIKVIKKVIN